MLLLIHDSTLNPQLLNNSTMSLRMAETRSMFYVFVKESEDIVLPLRNRKIKKVVSVVRCSTDRRIDFHQMRFVQTFELIGQFIDLAPCCNRLRPESA